MHRTAAPAVNDTGKYRYRCRVTRASYDPSAPEANSQVVTLRADSKEQAEQLAHHATGARVLDAWREHNSGDAMDAGARALQRELVARERERRDVVDEVNAKFPGLISRGLPS